jgi:hypothetical protein
LQSAYPASGEARDDQHRQQNRYKCRALFPQSARNGVR